MKTNNDNSYSLQIKKEDSDSATKRIGWLVVVAFAEGQNFVGEFSTPQHLEKLFDSHKAEGGGIETPYFLFKHVIVIPNLTEEAIHKTIDLLIERQEFHEMFSEIEEESVLKFLFKMEGLSQNQIDSLRFANRTVSCRYFQRSQKIYANIPLMDNTDYSWLKVFLKQNGISEENCRISISLTTEKDSAIHNLPDFVLRFIKEFGGYIEFSIAIE